MAKTRKLKYAVVAYCYYRDGIQRTYTCGKFYTLREARESLIEHRRETSVSRTFGIEKL